MSSYFSVCIPFTRNNPTEWHPTTDVGPLSVVTRGAFDTESEARTWAFENIPDHAYSVKEFGADIRLHTHRALHQMTNVVNERHPIESFIGDLIYDGYTLAQLDHCEPFAWFLGKCGTHIARNAEFFSAVNATRAQYEIFFWDGDTLQPWEDRNVNPFNGRKLRE